MSHNVSDIDWARVHFRKSTRSDGTSNGNCVEVGAPRESLVAIRDTKLVPSPDEFPHLLVDSDTWSGLIAGIKDGSIS